MNLKSFFFIVLTASFFILLPINPVTAGNINHEKILTECNNLNEWELETPGKTNAFIKTDNIDSRDVLEVNFDMAAPDLNTKNLYSGFSIIYKKPDFILGNDSALEINLLWEGNENYMRVALEDEEGFCKMVEFVHLFKHKGWQKILVTEEKLESWGGKPGTTVLGRIKKMKLEIFYSWSSGKGRILFNNFKIVRIPEQRIPLISVSQLGYRPEDKKFAVIKTEKNIDTGSFRLIKLPETEIVLEKKLSKVNFNTWDGTYYTADFTDIKKAGRYQFEVNFNNLWYRAEPFSIQPDIFSVKTAKLDFTFFKSMRSEDPLIFGYPELGGYRDAGTMLARYINTNTHVIYGISKFLLAKHTSREQAVKVRYAIDELRYGVKSMIAWQRDNGSVIELIVREPDIYPHNQFPEDNTYPWKIKEGNISTSLIYAAAMAAASQALKPYDKKLAEKALTSSKKAYKYTETQRLAKNSSAIGNFLWDSIELYKAAGEDKYLKKSKELASKLLKRQFLDFTRTSENICGNLSFSQRSPQFHFQYKLIHEAGMYFGLIELANFVKPDEPLFGNLRFFLKTFANQYLLKMSSLTPYKEIAEGLEPDKNGTFHVSFFHPPTGRLGVQGHGLNCDHLAYALMAVRLSIILNQPELEEFAANQLQWIFGVNPLGISMMSGIGSKEGMSLDKYLGLSPVLGGIMNGIVGHNGIKPYWAQHWVSGEYWLPHNAYYTAVIGEIENTPGLSTSKPFDISIDIPEAEGGKKLKLTLDISNTSNNDISSDLFLRARGSFSYEEVIPLNLPAHKTKKIVREINPTDIRSPGLITVSDRKHVLSEKYFLPKLPPFAGISLDDLVKIKPVSAEASSFQKNEKNVGPVNVIDGILSSRWSSEFSDPQWLTVDFGKKQNIKKIIIYWETAFAEAYEIQVTENKKIWDTIYKVDDEDGGKDDIVLDKPVKTRFIRFLGLRRGTQYGYSIFEIEFYKTK